MGVLRLSSDRAKRLYSMLSTAYRSGWTHPYIPWLSQIAVQPREGDAMDSTKTHCWGRTPWSLDFQTNAEPRLVPQQLDFAVIGGGFTGLATAAWLRHLDANKPWAPARIGDSLTPLWQISLRRRILAETRPFRWRGTQVCCPRILRYKNSVSREPAPHRPACVARPSQTIRVLATPDRCRHHTQPPIRAGTGTFGSFLERHSDYDFQSAS
jgi:hypothetical protein